MKSNGIYGYQVHTMSQQESMLKCGDYSFVLKRGRRGCVGERILILSKRQWLLRNQKQYWWRHLTLSPVSIDSVFTICWVICQVPRLHRWVRDTYCQPNCCLGALHSEDACTGLCGHLNMYVQVIAPFPNTPPDLSPPPLSIFEIIIFSRSFRYL